MSQRKPPGPADLLGSLEARILEDIWEHGESSVGEVLERLNRVGRRQLAYNTIMSVMSRLVAKGILERERVGRAFRYQACFTRQEFPRVAASRAVEQVFDRFGEAAMEAFIDHVADRAALRRKLASRLDA